MTTVVALLLVGVGSVAYRMLPLLGAARVPEAVSTAAGWAGISVLTAVTVRGVLSHEDDSIPWAVPVALVSVGLGLALAARGPSAAGRARRRRRLLPGPGRYSGRARLGTGRLGLRSSGPP